MLDHPIVQSYLGGERIEQLTKKHHKRYRGVQELLYKCSDELTEEEREYLIYRRARLWVEFTILLQKGYGIASRKANLIDRRIEHHNNMLLQFMDYRDIKGVELFTRKELTDAIEKFKKP